LICSVRLPRNNQTHSGFLANPSFWPIALLSALAIILLALQLSDAQNTKPSQPSPHVFGARIELPVTLRQNVIAGNTPPGTKVQARLTLATLVNGVVIPEGAILSGEVTESAAKTKDNPSRLSIRLTSAQWKNHSAPLELSPTPYLTEWFYPPIPIRLHDHDHSTESGFPDATHSPGFGTGGVYPGQRNPMGPPMSPPGSSDPSTTEPRTSRPDPDTSQHREQFKGVESTRAPDGAPFLESKTLNIKLDKNTTYVFASGETGVSDSKSNPSH
jgi:hypothetical protein